MTWLYHFVDLTSEQKHHRRELLDQYGLYAQLSALVPILLFQLYRLAIWLSSPRQTSEIAYDVVPSSPRLKQLRESQPGASITRWRLISWWLEGEVASGWGLRGHWVAAVFWSTWLLFLCVHQTGDDYLHVTKRFGIVAASQFPLHYMLAMKSKYSPLAWAFRCSHEQLNSWHRLGGRIIYGLLLLHAVWYLNFFAVSGILAKRLTARVVVIGIVAFILLTIIASTSMALVRRWSYRVFFVLHLTIGIALPPLLWFHASHLRYYMAETLALFMVDLILRKLDTSTGFAIITKVPYTKLFKVTIPMQPSKIDRFRAAPGQHVYLSIPAASTPTNKSSPSIHDLLFNPFTVADVSETDITLVLRAQNGPTTTAIQSLAKLSKARPPINIEGPYGLTPRFPNLAIHYDRILLVAGGVGATFILPIYRSLREQMEIESRSPDRVTVTWSMRSPAESSWAILADEEDGLADDQNVKVFYTGSHRSDRDYDDELHADGGLEMDELNRPAVETLPPSGGRHRPDMGKIVDDAFMQGNEERVAILVCGPAGMARELRMHVGKWVKKGRKVWWHDESFGW